MHKVKRTLIWRILIIVVCTVFLSALLTTLLSIQVINDSFVGIKAYEMLPRARYIADISAMRLQYEISEIEYFRLLGDDNDIWDASIYIISSKYDFLYATIYADSQEKRDLVTYHMETVINGEEVIDEGGLVIGIPIKSVYGNILGGVFMVKPLSEVRAAISSIIRMLSLGTLLLLAIMLLPVYIASSSITRPIRRMTRIASIMAEGNFGTLAVEKGHGELASLSHSLNHLSITLSHTISDLTIERNRLKNILYGMSEGILVLDLNGAISEFNPAASYLLGGNGSCLPTNSEVILQLFNIINHSPADNRFEFDFRQNETVLRISATRLTGSSGAYAGMVVLISDITESARFEQARRDYVANVSHELRTPISAIRAMADTLNDGLARTEIDKQRYYGYIVKEANSISRLIDDLLELSRLQSNEQAFQKQKCDIYDIIESVDTRVHDFGSGNDKNVETYVENSLTYAYTNPDRAEQVLTILLDNAVNHSGDGAHITVCARHITAEDIRNIEHIRKKDSETANDYSGKLVISVKNPGSINESDMPHLFERFYKVDKAHSGGGTGLGLSIAKEVANILGEYIWVENKDGFVIFSYTLETFKDSTTPI